MKANQIIFRLKTYARFIVNAKPVVGHGIHSPFVYKLSSELLVKSRKPNANLYSVEQLRNILIKDDTIIQISDLGAGTYSSINNSGTQYSKSDEQKNETFRRISTLAKVSASSTKKCNLLYQLVLAFRPLSIIELGTSLGFATAAMAIADKNIPIHTIEGSSEIAKIAVENFKKLDLNNITMHIDSFDNVLPNILPSLQTPFFAFIDGNHKYEPTIKYFDQFIEKSDSGSILIFDDIHWSPEMEHAWEYIKKHPKTVFCIDLYHFGVVFFNEGVVKQNFLIRF
jgi:predicted O-methyltransferase YrrM